MARENGMNEPSYLIGGWVEGVSEVIQDIKRF